MVDKIIIPIKLFDTMPNDWQNIIIQNFVNDYWHIILENDLTLVQYYKGYTFLMSAENGIYVIEDNTHIETTLNEMDFNFKDVLVRLIPEFRNDLKFMRFIK